MNRHTLEVMWIVAASFLAFGLIMTFALGFDSLELILYVFSAIFFVLGILLRDSELV